MPEQPTKVPDEWIAALKRHELLTAFRHAATAYQRQSVAKGLPKPTDYEAAVAATKLAPFTHAIAGHPLPDNAKLLAKALPSFDLLARIENPPAALSLTPAEPKREELAAPVSPAPLAMPPLRAASLASVTKWVAAHLAYDDISLTAGPRIAPSAEHYAWWEWAREQKKEFFGIYAKTRSSETEKSDAFTDDDRTTLGLIEELLAGQRRAAQGAA